MPSTKRLQPTHRPESDETAPRYRSGAVARMVGMPVATLRTWERRFQVITPIAAHGGQRLYSAADVQRLTLLKQLADAGQSIGVMARLDFGRLRAMATTHLGLQRGRGQATGEPLLPWRVAVVGAGLARRLERPPILTRLGRRLEVIGSFDSMAECLAAALVQAGAPNSRARRAKPLQQLDLLLVSMPTLHEGKLPDLQHATVAWRARSAALLYSYATSGARDAATSAGTAVQRGPLTDTGLADWLRGLGERASASGSAAPAEAPLPDPMLAGLGPAPARRYDDATLVDLASRPTGMSCECPRHVAELLLQVAHFEAYSAECASEDSVEADLHRYLHRATAAARAIFEGALERVAAHEGLSLKA